MLGSSASWQGKSRRVRGLTLRRMARTASPPALSAFTRRKDGGVPPMREASAVVRPGIACLSAGDHFGSATRLQRFALYLSLGSSERVSASKNTLVLS